MQVMTKGKPLSGEQVEQFRTHGWLAVPEFWTPDEIAAMREELERLKRDGKLRNVTTEGDGKTHSTTKQNLQLCPMSPHSRLFRAMPFAPHVIGSVSQLIGDPVVFHLDKVFIKPGRHGVGTNWHQDNAYFRLEEPLAGTALWTAVHDATLENGTIRVIPDLFRERLEHERDAYSDHHIRCYPPEERAIPVELPAGGAVFFAYGTPHATGANQTDRERAGVALHFFNGNYHADGGFQPEKRLALTGPEASDGEREYGECVAGSWNAEVARVLSGDLASVC